MGDSNVDNVWKRINHDKEMFERKQFERIEVDSFSLAIFWNQFGSAVQAVSNEVTKIGFMCGKKPFPTKAELESMLATLFQHYTAMRDLFLVLPEEVGATVYNATTTVVIRILSALAAVVHSLRDLTDRGAKERLTLTGTLWDACNAVDSIPKNNVLAVLSVLDDETSLAKDALDELTTAKMESSVEDQQSQNSRQNPCSAQNKVIMELISDELKKHLLELDITKWNKKKKINTRYCLTGKDGSSHRVRAVKLKRLVTNYM